MRPFRWGVHEVGVEVVAQRSRDRHAAAAFSGLGGLPHLLLPAALHAYHRQPSQRRRGAAPSTPLGEAPAYMAVAHAARPWAARACRCVRVRAALVRSPFPPSPCRPAAGPRTVRPMPVMENWQSGYLRFTLFMALTVWVLQRLTRSRRARHRRPRVRRGSAHWQSEFLAVGSMAIPAVYLRQRGSPESKPVGAPHHATGIES